MNSVYRPKLTTKPADRFSAFAFQTSGREKGLPDWGTGDRIDYNYDPNKAALRLHTENGAEKDGKRCDLAQERLEWSVARNIVGENHYCFSFRKQTSGILSGFCVGFGFPV